MSSSSTSTTINTNNTTTNTSSMKVTVNLNEKDIIKLIIEFLGNRELNISMLDLERETGVCNGAFSDDTLFLRQLILDGQWDDAIEFVQPLRQIEAFNAKQFHFTVMKYQYLELLCLKSEAHTVDNQLSVDQLVTYLNDLRAFCPSEEEYKKLCLLLTSPRLQDHSEYKAWNPSSGRLQCFKECLPLVSRFLSAETSGSVSGQQPLAKIAQNERLTQLIVKGLLYESCVEYCQARATSSLESYNLTDPSTLLMQMHLSETDASLLSWLHALPFDTFSCPFEEKPLKLNMDRFVKPNLEAAWADAILATPIKPQQLFPYNAVPTGRSRNTELMSRSLAPQYEGLSFGLSKSQIFTSGIEMKLNQSSAASSSSSSSQQNQHHLYHTAANGNNRSRNVNDLTKSIALFNLDTNKSSNETHTSAPTSSVTTPQPSVTTPTMPTPRTTPTPTATPTLLTSSFINNRSYHPIVLNDIKEEVELPTLQSPCSSTSSVTSSSSSSKLNKSNGGGSGSGSGTKKKKSSNGDQVNKDLSNKQSNPMIDSTLFKEYQKNKAQIIQQIEEQEKRREEFVKQLKSPNVYNALNAVSKSTQQRNSTATTTANKSNTNGGSISPNDLSNNNTINEMNNLNDDELYMISPKTKNLLNISSTSNTSHKANKSMSSSSSPPPQTSVHPQQQQSQQQSQPQPITTDANLAFQSANPTSNLSNNNRGNSNSTNSKAINTRPINEAYKFDSLEDITKAASFHPICVIEDQQAIRAVDIHPSGHYYVVGSNSKCLRVCPFPSLVHIKADHQCKPASVLYKKSKHHYGSIYCCAWNPSGNLIATGSNDKTIKLVKFTPDLVEDNDSEIELTYHNGTVRDLIFMQQEDNNILISGGAGDCKLHVLDCQTQQSLRVYSGHTGHIYTMYTWSGTKNVFVTGSQDKSCKFWDLRAPESIQTFTPTTNIAMQGSPVASVAVDPSGLLLSSGHEDAACCLYDIRGSRIVQIYKPHTSDIRSVRFSANAYYLLTSSYDNKVIITDLHGDLTKPLSWSVVAQHNDKIIQAKWHPNQMAFITTSADRTSIVWSLPSAMLANASVV